MAEFEFKSLERTRTHPIVGKVWTFLLVIVLAVTGMLFLPWQQTVRGEGSLIALDPAERDYTVLATIDGFIEGFHVREEQHVAAETKLFTMVDADKEYGARLDQIGKNLRQQLVNTQNEVKLLKQRRTNTREAMQSGLKLFDQRHSQAKETLESLHIRRKALQTSFDVEHANRERNLALHADAIVSKRQLEQAENRYVSARVQLEKNGVEISMQERSLTMIQEEKRQFLKETQNRVTALENDILGATNRIEGLKQQQERQSAEHSRYGTSVVTAPKAGHVLRILQNDTNRYTRRGEAVLHFAPKVTTRALLLKVSDFNMPLIKEGLPVRIKFYGWPALQISGWPKIRFGTFGGIVKKIDPISYEKGFYYAYVVEDPDEPWPDGDTLRPGTQANAWVALSTVPIWYQVWRQMNAFPPEMVHPVTDTEKLL